MRCSHVARICNVILRNFACELTQCNTFRFKYQNQLRKIATWAFRYSSTKNVIYVMCNEIIKKFLR